MIKELLSNLVNTIATVDGLGGRVGAAVGGTSQDPELTQVPVPFAWVIFTGCQDVEPERGAGYQMLQYNFSVMVGIEYGGSETDFLDTHITILEKVPGAVLGVTPYKYADEWKYEGCVINRAKANRLIYMLNFSVIGHHIPGQNP